MFNNHLIRCKIFEEIKFLKKLRKKSLTLLFHIPKPAVRHRFLLIAFNQSLIERMK